MMEELVNLLVNNGVAVVVIAYFMFRDYKFIQNLNTNIQKMIDVIILTDDEKKAIRNKEKGGE
ncbi:MAG: hypothetical protein J6S67_06045 [Methanobrevibacter sp.]|nr:hypothetical protein [Methanobrevibacter sp.]